MKHRFSNSGFTLLELLVAMAVGSLVVVMLLSILSGMMSLSRKANDSLLAGNAAAAALDMIGTDLESLAVTGKTNFEFLRLASETVESANDVAKLLLLTVSANDMATGGDSLEQTRAVMYHLGYEDVVSQGGANRIYGLYRSTEVDSATVFNEYIGTGDLSATGLFTAATRTDDFLAGNIVDFRVRFYESDTLELLNPDPTDTLRVTGAGAIVDAAPPVPLGSAEISLTYLEEAGAKLLQSGALTFEQAKQRYGYTLGRKVLLRTPVMN